MTIRWEQITFDNLTNIEQALEMYDQAFPIEVREPHSIFIESLNYPSLRAPNSYRFVVGYEGDQLVSFATGHYFADANFGFIVYIAIDPNVRSKGWGSETLSKLEELLNQDAISAGNSALKAIVLETEKIEMVHTEGEKEDCIKRNRFFERNGYKQLKEVVYIQPPLNAGENSVPLNLFINSHDISQQEIAEFIQVMYREKYFLVNGIDKKILSNCLEKMGIEKVTFNANGHDHL